MRISAEITAFCDRLGHRFTRTELVVRALTHASIGSSTRPDNQRLEFLGDRVLGLVMAEVLLAADRAAAEGQLAPRFNALVRREALAEVARGLDLGAVLRMGRSEMLTGGRRKEALLADAMEAVIAAVYLDAGLEAARGVILRHWRGLIDNVDADARDAKTTLQELVQARGEPPPAYTELAREGPPHAPLFTIAVQLADGTEAQAQAGSKRQGEQEAARAMLQRLENKDE